MVADVIANDKQQAEQFASFHHISLRKLASRAESAYNDPNYFAEVEDTEAYLEVKDRFGSRGWSTKNLKELAKEVVANARERLGLSVVEAKKQAETFYLGGADLSSPFIHASMMSVQARVKDLSNQTITFKDEFEDYGAFPMAVCYFVMVLETQDRFFGLGLESEVARLNEEVHTGLSAHYKWAERSWKERHGNCQAPSSP